MLPQRILWSHLDDFVLVEDEEMMLAVRRYLELVKTLAEPRRRCPLAAAMRLQPQLRGRQVALVLSGGNISPEEITLCLQRTAPVRSTLRLKPCPAPKGLRNCCSAAAANVVGPHTWLLACWLCKPPLYRRIGVVAPRQ